MKRIFQTAGIILISIITGTKANAQHSQMAATYFQNQYLGNPAFAGKGKGLDLSLGMRQQWSNIPGSPAIQALSLSYGLNDKVGLGLIVYNDKSGLFRSTRTVASYAYHLPLNEEQKLSFGLSLGLMSERINYEDIRGDPNDISAGAYNQREKYLDGDFGLLYASNRLNVQAALPNMKEFFKKDIYNDAPGHSIFFSALSYKIQLEGTGGFGLEPKLVYRVVNDMDNIIDAGANLSYENNKLNMFGMYHSSGSSTFGLGLNYQNIGFSGMYSTATSALSNYANGNFELNVKILLLK